jgi:hypothetical protein
MTFLQFIVRQTAGLSTEEDGNSSIGELGDEILRYGICQHEWPRYPSLPRAGTNDPLAIGNRIGNTRENLYALEHVLGTGCPPLSLWVREALWIHHRKIAQTHRFQRARSTSDIAGMTGLDEDNSDLCEQLLVAFRHKILCGRDG